MWIQCCDKSDFFLCLEFMKCLSNLIVCNSGDEGMGPRLWHSLFPNSIYTHLITAEAYHRSSAFEVFPDLIIKVLACFSVTYFNLAVDVDNNGAIDSFLAATVHLTESQNSLTKMLWLQNHCLCSPSLQIIGLKKSWKLAALVTKVME
ncbi:hypothetical protein NC653_040595 [Populus alba x Populus x berolinensis]|uniref:Uncharacterized protein n=1 Tax=Populus alba x Populus x berolinensis TaxID=444605 RepID=A0AAD6PNA5_9ROSI|nr:hypothetical protein NC653_040595 [Populus alba x Populus x berolinensis]